VNVPEPVPAALLEADSAFDSGDFAKAARSYASYLQSNPQTSGMDRILFRFVVAQSLNVAAPKDLSVNDALNRLIREFPHSAYVEPSQVILNLRADIARSQADVKAREETIRQLNDELERLKKIDLGRPKAP
jgi:outer membrane protein assembly factor BamD (BamD/ComL family)